MVHKSRPGLLDLINTALERVVGGQIIFDDWVSPELPIASNVPGGLKVVRPPARLQRRVCWLGKDHVRVEMSSDAGVIRAGVRAGDEWWRWDQTAGFSAGRVAPNAEGLTSLPPLLAPVCIAPFRLIATHRIVGGASGHRAGRQVIEARAEARSGSPQQFLLELDAEHGTLLSRVQMEQGRVVRRAQANTVAYGSDIQLTSDSFPIVATFADFEAK